MTYGDPQNDPTPRGTLQWLMRQMAEVRGGVGLAEQVARVWLPAVAQALKNRGGNDAVRLNITSLLSSRDQQGRVELSLAGADGVELTVQLDPPQVENLVVQLLSCAQAARTDTFLWAFFADEMKLTPTQAGALINQSRKFREREAAAQSALEWTPNPIDDKETP